MLRQRKYRYIINGAWFLVDHRLFLSEGGDGAGDGGSSVESIVEATVSESVVESASAAESGSTVESSVVEASAVEATVVESAVVSESGSGLGDDCLCDGGATAAESAAVVEAELGAEKGQI